MEPREIIGHVFGVGAIALNVLSYQMRGKKAILLVQSGGTLLACIQYLLIGAFSGFALNVVCLARNFFFYHRDKKFFSGIFFPILFACILPIVSIFSWEGYHSLLIIAGLMINTLCLGLWAPQGLRRSILLTSTLIMIYNVFAGSYSGIVLETLSIISSVIGLVRYSKDRREDTEKVDADTKIES